MLNGITDKKMSVSIVSRINFITNAIAIVNGITDKKMSVSIVSRINFYNQCYCHA